MQKTFGILGHPVAHSLSPAMFQAAFFKYQIEAEYERFDVNPEGLNFFLDEIRAGKRSVAGLSVTIPHKETIMSFLDEVDEKARLIGAVNTVVNRSGKLKGFNTDWIGAQRALEEIVSGSSLNESGGGSKRGNIQFLAGKRVMVLGAGGAAAAIVYACLQAGAEVTILNRNLEKAQQLAERFSKPSQGTRHVPSASVPLRCTRHEMLPSEHAASPGYNEKPTMETDTLDNILQYQAEILIHTTSVGMHPNVGESLIPPQFFKRGMVVFDIVYNPLETKLVRQARAAGCRIIPGYKMLLYQAEKQFELWFKKRAPVEAMEKSLLEGLNR